MTPVVTPPQIIDGVLEGIEFTRPIEFADVVEVHRRITVELSKHKSTAKVEVYHRLSNVVVTAREPGRHDPIYKRILEAK